MSQRFRETSIRADYRVYAALVGLLAFLVYLRTLAPTVMWYDMGELTTTSYVLGIAHNTGYPLYILLGKLFTFLPFGDVAYRVNLMSAVFAALTVSVVFVIIHDLTKSILAALFGALTLAFSSTLWSTAVWAESYSLNAFFTAVITLLLLRWREGGQARQLYLASLLFGLSMGNHRLILLLVPGILLFLCGGKAVAERAAAVFAADSSSCWGCRSTCTCRYGARRSPPLNWAQPANFHTYLSMFLTGSSPGEYWDFAFFDHLDVVSRFPLNEFTVFGVALAALGLGYVWRRDRLFAVYGLIAVRPRRIRCPQLQHPQHLQLLHTRLPDAGGLDRLFRQSAPLLRAPAPRRQTTAVGRLRARTCSHPSRPPSCCSCRYRSSPATCRASTEATTTAPTTSLRRR